MRRVLLTCGMHAASLPAKLSRRAQAAVAQGHCRLRRLPRRSPAAGCLRERALQLYPCFQVAAAWPRAPWAAHAAAPACLGLSIRLPGCRRALITVGCTLPPLRRRCRRPRDPLASLHSTTTRPLAPAATRRRRCAASPSIGWVPPGSGAVVENSTEQGQPCGAACCALLRACAMAGMRIGQGGGAGPCRCFSSAAPLHPALPGRPTPRGYCGTALGLRCWR